MTNNITDGRRNWGYALITALILLLALDLRTAGLFRSLDDGNRVPHPDVPKQMLALENYLAGRYFWHCGDPFYDGYPYGLNHVDEWIIRAAWPLAVSFTDHFRGGTTPEHFPGGVQLHRHACALRVLYGMLSLILAFLAAMTLVQRKTVRAAVYVLMAIAPVSVAVTHFATGDVGVDLFISAMTLALAHYALGRRLPMLLAAGFACGFAFGCKFQGSMGFFVIASFLAAETWARRGSIAALAGKCALSFAGFLAGAVASTPALLINFRVTWADTILGLRVIREFGVTQEFLRKSLTERIWLSFRDNSGGITGWLGISLCLLAAIGLVLVTLKLWRLRRRDDAEPAALALCSLSWAVCAFPLFVMVFSLALKPAVQPFHFSFIQASLCLAAGIALGEAMSVPGRAVARWACGLLLVVALADFAVKAARENYFWSREDTQQSAESFARHLCPRHVEVHNWGVNEPPVRYFYLQPDSPAVFRNSTYRVLHDSGEFWREIHIAPVPSTPFPLDDHWIFMNGPVFPRSDRMFEARAGWPVEKEVVFYGRPPESVDVGIRSGPHPVEVSLELGGRRIAERLDSDSQRIVKLTPGKFRRFRKCGPDGTDVFVAGIKVGALVGKCWITLMNDRREIDNYLLFGAESLDGVHRLKPFLESTNLVDRVREILFAGDDSDNRHLAAASPLCLLSHSGTPLPAGPYVMEFDLSATSWQGADALNLRVIPMQYPGKYDYGTIAQSAALTGGLQTVRFQFSKPFAPHEVNFILSCRTPGNAYKLLSWRLAPDAETVRKDLAAYLADGTRPSWFAKHPAADLKETALTVPSFDNRLILRGFSFPAELYHGREFPYAFRLDMLDYGIRNFSELNFFVHLADSNGKYAAGFDFPLAFATFGSEPLVPVSREVPKDLRPGTYGLRVGVYNTRTSKRIPLAKGRLWDERRDAVDIGTVTVVDNASR